MRTHGIREQFLKPGLIAPREGFRIPNFKIRIRAGGAR